MRFKLIVTTAALIGALTGPAFAQAPGDLLVTFTNTSFGSSPLLNVSSDGSTYPSSFVGRFQGNLGGHNINDFCVDINHDILANDSYTADVSHSLAEAAGPQIGNYFNGGIASALNSGYYNPVAPNPVTNQQRANEVSYLVHTYDNANVSTFQLTGVSLAIWDIEQDGGDGITSGLVQLQPNQASTYAAEVGTLESQAAAYKNTSFMDVKWIQAPVVGGGNGYQSFAYVAPVPEAGTMTLFALVLAGGTFRLRTLRKKKRAFAA